MSDDTARVAVALLQMRASEDPAENLTRNLDRIEEAAARGAKIICTQELFCSRYFCQAEEAERFDLAEPIPGPTTEALSEAARRLGVVLIGSLFERRAEGIYHNTAVVIDADGSLLGRYRKMHIPDDPLYYEKFYFTPGDLGFPSFQTRFGRVGVLICWDQWFPEAARLCALSGAQIIFYPTAIGWQFDEGPAVDTAQHDAWETVQRGHAVANGVFVAAANRVGHEDGIQFFGQSFVADPSGGLLALASSEEEEILLAEVDLARVEQTRRDWPFLRDRRIDAFGDLTLRYRDED